MDLTGVEISQIYIRYQENLCSIFVHFICAGLKMHLGILPSCFPKRMYEMVFIQ